MSESEWVDDPAPQDGDWVDDTQTDPLMSGIRKGLQGATAGFSDEAAGLVEGAGRALGFEGAGAGPISDIKMSDDGPTLDWEILRDAYKKARDRERGALKKDSKDNPEVSAVAEIGGAIASPINKLMPGASMAKSGAAIGGITGLGASEAEDIGGMALDTAKGAGLGLALGYGADKASPYIQKGADKVGDLYHKAKTAFGEKIKSAAEQLAFKSNGSMLKDFRTAANKGKVNDLGRYMLDNGLEAGDTFTDVAEKFSAKKLDVGEQLDDLYKQAGELFKDKMSQGGFDPIRDKSEILAAARDALGNTVGAEAAVAKLGGYLDEVAARHGDAPMQAALAKYGDDVAEYLPKQRQFLKDKRAYQNALGKAGEDLNQAVLPGVADDFQRTGSAQRQIELYGKDAAQMFPEGADFGKQMDLLSLPQRPPEGFNIPRGDDLLPFQQQMALDEMGSSLMLGQGQQGAIKGTELVPRSFQNVDDVAIQSGKGQMQMPFAPEAPIRPVRPGDIRNPMSPRAANDIKSSLDEAINYSRNPLSKEPAAEVAYSAARNKINQKNLDNLESLGGGEIVDALRAANKNYGASAEISKIAKDRVNRESANRMYGLTDFLTGGAATTYGAVTGDWKTALGAMAMKKGMDKMGVSTLAVAADKISKQLLKSPQMQKMAAESPKAFGAMIYNLVQRAEEGGMSLPRAADKDNGAMNFNDSNSKDALLQKTQGSQYAQVLQNAANNGDQSLSAAHYVLSQRDPNYRKLIEGGK